MIPLENENDEREREKKKILERETVGKIDDKTIHPIRTTKIKYLENMPKPENLIQSFTNSLQVIAKYE